MYLREVCNENFVMIQANWTVARTRELIERLNPDHVILHRAHPSAPAGYYYVYGKSELLNYLLGRGDTALISDAIQLHEWGADPTYDAYSDAGKAPSRTVVVQDGHVIGFYDKTIPPARSGPLLKSMPGGGVTRGMGTAAGAAPSPLVQPEYRSLTADFPEQVPLGEIHSLLISLSTLKQIRAVAPAGSTNIRGLRPGDTLDVVVRPQAGFELVGSGESTLVVDDPAKSTVPCKLKATELGAGKISVFAFYKQQLQGTITLAPVVVQATEPVGPTREHKQEVEESVRVIEPDLSLLIFSDNASGKPTLSFMLSASDSSLGYHLKQYGPVDLQIEPLRYFQAFFKDIENLPLGTPQEKAFTEQRLAAKGCMLFQKAIPSDLQVALWSLRNQIKSVQVESQEPWIPWEICKLVGRENGSVVEGPFFCEAFAVTRWRMGIGMKPTLNLNNMALVVPQNSGLPSAATEGAYVQSLANGGRKVTRVPATYLDVIAEMRKGEYDAWHFTGHGGFTASDPNRSVIVLEDHYLTPEDLSGVVTNVGKPKPFVFLNACQIGRNALSLTRIGGWASQFLDAGAGAFVGAYWSVYDQPAHDFAVSLYSGLERGVPIGRAVREARLAIKPLGDPTWLAYTVCADPLARIT